MHDDKNFKRFYIIWQVLYIILGIIHLIQSFLLHFKPYDLLSIIYISLLIIMILITWYFVARLREEPKITKFTVTSAILWTVTLLVVIFRTFVI